MIQPQTGNSGFSGSEKSSGSDALFFKEKIKNGKTESSLYTYIKIKTHIHPISTHPLLSTSFSLSNLDSVFPFPF